MTPDTLREWRDQHGWSQTQLAEAIGVASMTISRWERGDMEIRHPTMLRLALERLAQKRRRK
jgi:transcriptional regulator with XRE-family HTH domain